MKFHELQQIVESNARATQAMLDAQASDRLQRADLLEAVVGINEAIQRLTTLNEGVVNLPSSLDEDRPTILKRQSNKQTNPNGHSDLTYE